LPALSEWETRTFPGIALSEGDRGLLARLGEEAESRLVVDELRDGLRVRARSWVGVVRLETVELRILPKLAGEQLGLVQMLEVTEGLEGLWRLEADATLDVSGGSLLDLVALLFAEATEGVLRRGLMPDYQEREEDLPVVRGRILADRQVLRRFGRLDRIECRFDELEQDVDENRLLVAALRVAVRRVVTPGVQRRLGRLRAVLEPVCTPEAADLRTLRHSLTYNRLNTHYKQAHTLAWLILDALGVDDLLTPGSTRSFAFLLNMNRLFEQFVERLLEAVLGGVGYRVDGQLVHSSIIWNATTEKYYARVIPDILIRLPKRPSARLAVDAKYKLYDQKKIASADVYQAFLYAYALSKGTDHHTEAPARLPTSILIYPSATSATQQLALEVRPLQAPPGARILALGLSIPAALSEFKARKPGPITEKLRALAMELLQP